MELLSIDIHTHILPADIPDFGARYGYRGFIHLDHHKPGCARMMMDDKFFRAGRIGLAEIISGKN